MVLDLYQNVVSLNIFRTNGQNLTHFICALILTRSNLRLLAVTFGKFITQLWPLIYVQISFLLNIFRTNGQNITIFYIFIRI